eukprot:GHVU01183379.1.p1 GENE.GHVU01183379.1~~GHVU01183379.1.p1  ORF type:complete len:552 (+),score=42.31 GHVU01183379.1:1207-2862(+)
MSYTKDNLKEALRAIKLSKLSYRAAQNKFHIPKSTLQTAFKKGRLLLRLGRPPVLPSPVEAQIASRCKELCKLFFAITTTALRKLAYQLAERNKLPHTFSHENQMAGVAWQRGFFKRNPKLAKRVAEPTSLNRILGFNTAAVGRFYSNLGEEYRSHEYAASDIFNMDETGVKDSIKIHPLKVVAEKGQHQVGKLCGKERGRLTTLVLCCSAAGIYIPPMMIFGNRERRNPILEVGAPVDSIFAVSHSGWIKAELFFRWCKHFVRFSGASPTRKKLLIFDNHESHLHYDSIEYLKDNGVRVVTLPSHTTHKLQPLDVAVMYPLKNSYRLACDAFQTLHGPPTQENVAEIFGNAWKTLRTVDIAQSGFKATGVWPFNPQTFTDEEFRAADHMRGLREDIPPNVSEVPPVISPDAATEGAEYRLTPLRTIGVPKSIPKPKRKVTNKKESELLTSTPLRWQLKEKAVKKRQKAMGETQRGKAQKKKRGKKQRADYDEIDPHEQENFCALCNGFYGDTSEDWIGCRNIHCEKWYHVRCAVWEGDLSDFVCVKCDSA